MRRTILFVLVACLLASHARGDNRPVFERVYGDAEQVWWAWIVGGSQFDGKVWEDFTELDSHAPVVAWADRFWKMAEGHEWDCVVVLVPNPGWRGRRGDMAWIEWNKNDWQQFGKFDCRLTELRTLVR